MSASVVSVFYSRLTQDVLLVLILALTWIIALGLKNLLLTRGRLPFPPGPRPLPVIGNVKDFPKVAQWLTFARWAKQYGDIMSISLLGTRVVILDSLRAVTDLLEKKSAIYSDRPRMPMIVELMGHTWALPAMRYGDKWRLFRKAFHQYFSIHAVASFEHIQRRVVHRLLRDLLDVPNDFRRHVKHATVAIAIDIAYGFHVSGGEDKYVEMAEAVMESLNKAGVPGAFMVDVFPILKYLPSWFPGGGFQVTAKQWRKAAYDFLHVPYNDAKAAIAVGDSASSLVARMSADDELDRDDSLVPGIAAVTYIAGSDTTASTLNVFFLAMVLHPECQRAAQAELDVVLGKCQRLPELADQPSLPYIQAVIKEVLRWLPVTPLAVAHAVTEADEYDGYFIPKGSMVLGNAWSILHNEQHYPDPFEFRPDRFLKRGKLSETVLDPEVAAFGFGRRKCPGRFAALNTLFLTIASILTCFDIESPVDDEGQPVPVEPRMTTHLTQSPEPFECRISPRFPGASALIRQ